MTDTAIQTTLSNEEWKLVMTLREIPDSPLRAKVSGLLGELVRFIQQPRCLGMQMDDEADTLQITWQPGDILLLCTDGLSGLVSDQEMLSMSTTDVDPQDACQKLIDLAMARGGYDNITDVLIRYEK